MTSGLAFLSVAVAVAWAGTRPEVRTRPEAEPTPEVRTRPVIGGTAAPHRRQKKAMAGVPIGA
ncbi:hypothetical protein FHS42_000874 [Streptomyces zagrosensis]|uniref:Uncharacterized protein n=1 Tax=Streptomyces zagrosensis TaxID=1042984 RepID=A0A7W9Q577_9ACTN|nr:hypothetical protein [Streptomyces zagrosensis]